VSNNKKKCNNLTGKEWLQNSFSIWRDLIKTKEERAYKHPASFPVSLCEKLIRTFAATDCNVFDPFNGIGSTTAAAAKLGCSAVGIDLSDTFCKTASKRVCDNDKIRIICGDSFSEIGNLPKASFDICVTSPPYWDILNMKHSADKKNSINYSDRSEDLGNIADYSNFISRLTELFSKVKDVLKPNAYCIVNVMDIRKKSNFYPLHSDLATALQDIGYIYDDLIIWDRQTDYNNMRPLGYPYKFRINKVHEYLLIFINNLQ
jgi:DNA modification methylase